MKSGLNRLLAFFWFVFNGTGFAFVFSMAVAPAASAVDYYWEEPLTVAGSTCVLIPFNENSGTSFYGQNTNGAYAMLGSFRSSGSAAWVSGKFGSALSFNGSTNQGVNVQQNGKLALTDENASWEFWFKLDKKLSTDQVVAQVGSSWQIKVRPSGQISLNGNHGGTWKGIDCAASLSTGVWTHVIFTRQCLNKSGNNADYTYAVYTNGMIGGKSVYTNTAVPASSTADMTMGYSIYNTAHLNGVVDDFRISKGIARRKMLNTDNETVFQNPHMGFVWTTNLNCSLSATNPIPPEYQMVRLIFGWSEVETNANQYNWSKVDSALQKLQSWGLTVNVWFMLANCQNPAPFVPAWLHQSPFNVGYTDVSNNCKGIASTRHPDYWNPTFQARATNILARFRERYETNNISFLLSLIYGNWGEWDSGNNPAEWPNEQTKTNTLRQLVDIYLNEFSTSSIPVASCTAAWEYASECQYPYLATNGLSHYLNRLALGRAFDNGMGIYLANMRGWSGWEPEWTQQGLLDLYGVGNFVAGEMGGNTATPISDPPSNVVFNVLRCRMNSFLFGSYALNKFAADYPAEYQMGMKNIGYRLIPSQITFPSCIQTGQVFSIDINWENLAVGRLIRPGYRLGAYLKDSNGAIRWQRFDSDFDPSLLVNTNAFDSANIDHWHDNGIQYPVHHNLARIPSTQAPGTYDLYIAIVDKNDVPAIRLPIDGDVDGSKRYFVGQVVVTQ